MNMYLGQTEKELPNAATALRWLDRNASKLKYNILTISEQTAFDDAVSALWEHFLNGRK